MVKESWTRVVFVQSSNTTRMRPCKNYSIVPTHSKFEFSRSVAWDLKSCDAAAHSKIPTRNLSTQTSNPDIVFRPGFKDMQNWFSFGRNGKLLFSHSRVYLSVPARLDEVHVPQIPKWPDRVPTNTWFGCRLRGQREKTQRYLGKSLIRRIDESRMLRPFESATASFPSTVQRWDQRSQLENWNKLISFSELTELNLPLNLETLNVKGNRMKGWNINSEVEGIHDELVTTPTRLCENSCKGEEREDRL